MDESTTRHRSVWNRSLLTKGGDRKCILLCVIAPNSFIQTRETWTDHNVILQVEASKKQISRARSFVQCSSRAEAYSSSH